MKNSQIKSLRLHSIVFNPALNDGQNGLLRCEANQWITDKRGNVTDIKHRLEADSVSEALIELESRAAYILHMFKYQGEK